MVPEDLDDSEDTLSLCDLPLRSSVSEWEQYFSSFKKDRGPSSDQELFEFFTAPAAEEPPQGTAVFCRTSTIDAINNKGKEPIAKDLKEDKSSKEGSTLSRVIGFGSASYDGSCNEYGVKRSSSMRSKWHICAFGVGRYPLTLQVGRKSQKKIEGTSFSEPSCNNDSQNNRKRLWRVMNVLGCINAH